LQIAQAGMAMIATGLRATLLLWRPDWLFAHPYKKSDM
jgi:hypothetical protein